MKKQCPLCRKLMEIDSWIPHISEKTWLSACCPHCSGELLIGDDFGKIVVESRKFLFAKCPCCRKKISYDISGVETESDSMKIFEDYSFRCSICGTALVAHGILRRGRCKPSDLWFDINRFANFKAVYYVIAAKGNFATSEIKGNIPRSKESLRSLEKILQLPSTVEELCALKRYKDYQTWHKKIQSFLVSEPNEVVERLPKGWKIIYTSTNLLKPDRRDKKNFAYLLWILTELVSSIRDICGKTHLISSVVQDLGEVQSKKASEWRAAIMRCESDCPLNDWSDDVHPTIIDFMHGESFSARKQFGLLVNRERLMSELEKDTLYQRYQCIHPYSLEKVAQRLGYDFNEAAGVLVENQVKILDTDTEHIRWQDYADQFPGLKLKGTAMHFGAGKAVRSVIGDKSALWKKVRKTLIARENNTCQICGFKTEETKYLHAHEVWEQHAEKNVLILKDIELLCNHCHDCLHMGQATVRGETEPREMQYNYDKMVLHMASVNACEPKTIYAYLKYKGEMEQREKIVDRKRRIRETSIESVEENEERMVCYIISECVPNKVELEQALEKKGLLYRVDKQ